MHREVERQPSSADTSECSGGDAPLGTGNGQGSCTQPSRLGRAGTSGVGAEEKREKICENNI